MVLAEAARIHLICRALARALQAFDREGSARSGWRRVALGTWAGADLALWWAIRHNRVRLVGRLAADLVDVAFWASCGNGDLTLNLAAQIAVELEAGMAWGAAGLAIPALEAATSTLGRRFAGRHPDPSAHIPHVGAVVGGMAMRWGERLRMGRAREQHAAERSAKVTRAFLAGQNAVAMGAASVMDRLTPVAAMLGVTDPDSALYQVRAGWKASLAEQSRRHAIYLDQALRLWEQRHNDHPDLSGYVIVSAAEGDGTTLLTGHQARALAERLEQRDLRGEIRVALADPEQAGDRRPGRQFDLLVNDSALQVPADPAIEIHDFNPAPPILFFASWAALMPIRPHDGAVPAAWAIPTAVAYLVAAWYLGRPAHGSPAEQITVGLVLAAAHGAVCARFATVRHSPAGAHLFHGTYGIGPAVMLLSANWHRAPVWLRYGTIGGLAAIPGLAYAAAEPPRSAADLICDLAWPLATLGGVPGIIRATAHQAETLTGQLEAEDDVAEALSFDEGRQSVLTLVRAAVAEAETTFTTHSDLASDVSETIRQRLQVIRALIDPAESTF